MINCCRIDLIENEHLYGPGKRLLIYLQGCSLHCRGCFNVHTWKFGIGTDHSSEYILNKCREENVEGVTILGGEPLDQANDLLEIVRDIKKEDFTIILFTGYEEEELEENQKKIWDLSDIVICGRYIEAKRDLYLQFRGSTNQRVICHSGKYENYKVQDGEKTQAVITISNRGDINFRGFYPEDLEELLKEAFT